MQKNELKTPCFIIQKEKLINNLEILNSVKKRTGCHILLAQKCFSMYSLYPLIGQYVDGCTASGLFEAKLGYEHMHKENHVFSCAYREDEIDEIISYCDHIVFNSFAQMNRYKDKVLAANKSIGLRINPEFSTQEGHAIYDPCAPKSRMGILIKDFENQDLSCVEGLHFHTLCEQNSDDLKSTIAAVEEKFGQYMYDMKWINFGGGHHVTRDDYDIDTLVECIQHIQTKYNVQVIIEPGEAFVLNAGILLSRVLETGENDILLAILDTSAACHMPDVLEMPYRPPVKNSGLPNEKKFTYRFAGPTCLAGDVIGDYSFDQKLQVGDFVELEDMALYTMVKTNMFNGMNLPDIVVEEDNDYVLYKRFGYEDFKSRL